MSKLKQLIKLTFFTTPKSAWELAEQNQSKIGFLTVLIMAIIIYLAMIGVLNTWTIIK